MHEPDQTIADIFAEASERVLSGQTIESIVEQLPNNPTELEPMLRVTRTVRDLPTPELPPDMLARVQQRAQAAAAKRSNSYQTATTKLDVVSAGPRSASRMAGILPGILCRMLSPITETVPRSSTLRTGFAALVVLIVAGAALLIATLTGQQDPERAVAVYEGVITKVEPGIWYVGDEQILIDPATEIHGVPAVGVHMTCIGQDLPGERMRALEVWIGPAPGAPTIPPAHEGFRPLSHALSALY